MFQGARDPYAIDDDDMVMVDRADADPHSSKDETRGSKRLSKRVRDVDYFLWDCADSDAPLVEVQTWRTP